jgi:leucyl-tRNA synthetase
LKSNGFKAAIEILVKIIGPMMPHLAEEMWSALGHQNLLYEAAWPEVDASYLGDSKVTIAVQVMGKLRDTLEVAPDTSKEELEALALALDKVQRAIDGRDIKKIIVVPGKIVNIVAP